MGGADSPSTDEATGTARETVRAYYDALRTGEPLGPFFADERDGDDDYVKFGISERLDGSAAIREGLADQTATTADWHVDSRDLRVVERASHAWFSDAVVLSWTDADHGIRYEFDTRWSGTLERRPADDDPTGDGRTSDGGGPTGDDGTPEGADVVDDASVPERWRFVGMHVSTAGEL